MKKCALFGVSIEMVKAMFRIFKKDKLQYFINAMLKVFLK